MFKKKRIVVVGLVIILLVLAVICLFYRSTESKSFSVSEKKWIEDNKNQVIDIAVINKLAYFGVAGEGIFFEFIDDLEKTTGLEFNMIPYNLGEKPLATDYVFEASAKIGSKQSLFYTDGYAVVGEHAIFNIDELKNQKIGILKDDINLGNYYLKGYNLVSYDNTEAIFKAYSDGEVDYIIVPYLPNIETIISNNYNVAYRLVDMVNNYVITVDGDQDKLNSIIQKYFDIWMTDKFDKAYDKVFADTYFNTKETDDQTKSSLLSKKYIYGYVSNLPYEKVVNGDYLGINKKYLDDFSALTGVEFIYREYESISSLKNALNDGDVDLAFGYFDVNNTKVNMTAPLYQSDYVVLVHTSNDVVMDSLKSLDDKEVSVIKNSLVHNYVKEQSKAEVNSYDNIDRLIRRMGKNSIIMIDKLAYNYYNDEFDKYMVIYESALKDDYGILISRDKDDEVFSELFSYFISSANKNQSYVLGYDELAKSNANRAFINLIIKYSTYVFVGMILVFYILVKVFKKKKVKKQIKKEDKLKFVDMLTSLKNRNYLNYNMEKWDNNDVYPQVIIVVDLNNIKYINDNFGHEEGDSVIVSAANILINNQMENSDIMRTDGNEFLIYMVGYKEEEVISYIRKLNKEFKTLSHGFGAAIGYSLIKDEITTIDDAINEATLDMRTNKENLPD